MNNSSLDQLVKELSKFRFVSAVFLFGSQATGKSRKDSDFDIAVITKNATRNQELAVSGYNNQYFDVSILERLPLIIQFRVIKEGKLLYCKDEKFLNEVKLKILRNYLDFVPFINNFYKKVIKNV